MKLYMKLEKKINFLKFENENKLFWKCYDDYSKSKSILISGGNSFDFFIKNFDQSNVNKKKKLILFDERISKNKKNRNFYKLDKYLIKRNLLLSRNFFNYEKIKSLNSHTIESLEKKLSRIIYPDLALIGVGNDGHIGSIFKNSINRSKNFLITKKRSENFYRISLNLDFIKKINKIIVVINNKKKKNIFNLLLKNDLTSNDLPIFSLINKMKKKINLYYTDIF